MSVFELEKRSASPSALLIEKQDDGWALCEGEHWIGTQYWLIRKERFERLPAAVRRIEGRVVRVRPDAMDAAAESVLKRVFSRAGLEFTLGELRPAEGSKVGTWKGIAVHALLGSDGELLPFLLNADLAAALEKVTPDCVWRGELKGGAARVDGNVPWAVCMMMRDQKRTS